MTSPPDLAEKDALIATLLARIETLTAANGLLIAQIAELESLFLSRRATGKSAACEIRTE